MGLFREYGTYSMRLACLSVVCYFGGLVLWLIDLHKCEDMKPYHFHYLWHLGAGYGTYLYVSLLVMLRLRILKLERRLKLEFQTCPCPLHAIQINTDKSHI